MAKSQSQTQDVKPEQVVYCGPNWLKHGLLKYQVLLCGMPYNLREALKEFPPLAGLICFVDELDTFRRKIDTKGTHEANLYEQAEEYISKGGRK